MLEVHREEGETIDHLLRRYNDTLRRIQFVGKVKARGFYSKKPSYRQRKATALYKMVKGEKMDHFKLIGKIEERHYNYRNNRRRSKISKTRN